MFNGAKTFNQSLNNWNVSKVTYMRFMFLNAFKFNQPLTYWDVSNIKYIPYMFNGAESFNIVENAPWYL